MAVTIVGNSAKMTAAADQLDFRINTATIRVVNGANAGDVSLTDVAGNEFWARVALAANAVDQTEITPTLSNGLKIGAMPTACEVFVYWG